MGLELRTFKQLWPVWHMRQSRKHRGTGTPRMFRSPCKSRARTVQTHRGPGSPCKEPMRLRLTRLHLPTCLHLPMRLHLPMCLRNASSASSPFTTPPPHPASCCNVFCLFSSDYHCLHHRSLPARTCGRPLCMTSAMFQQRTRWSPEGFEHCRSVTVVQSWSFSQSHVQKPLS